MPHSIFTIVAAVRREALSDLRDILAVIENDHAGNPYLRFTGLPGLHFASFTIFDQGEPGVDPLLVFESNVDGSRGRYLSELVSSSFHGLVSIYSCCTDLPVSQRTVAGLSRYLRAHSHKPQLYHVGTPYRLSANIVAERRLQQFIEDRADALVAGDDGKPPSWIWQRLRESARAPTSRTGDLFPVFDAPEGPVTWVANPERRLLSRFVNWLRFGILFAAAALMVGLLARSFWLDQVALTAVLTSISFLVGVGTSVLIGWPALRRWRDPVGIWLWFAAAGWAVSILPALFRMPGLSWPRALAPSGPWIIGTITVIVLAVLSGRWILPTPDLAHPVPDQARLASVLEQEDRSVQNHMSALVILRPGILRLAVLRLLLGTLKFTFFPTVLRDLEKGRLFGLPTVHFAQWITLDRGRYLFLSNYDHSWSRYLNDFATISFGLARLWGQGKCSPGLGNIERFKDFARTWMFPYSVWYRAYPALSVTQIWNNEKIRLGLLTAADDEQSVRLLRRLVAAGDR